MAEHYVYEIVDPRDGDIFYVGKGKGRRARDHINGRSHSRLVADRIVAIQAAGVQPRVDKTYYADHITAYCFERKRIDELKTAGVMLLNQVAGGAGRHDGRGTPSDAYRTAQGAKSRVNWKNPDYRRRVIENGKAARKEMDVQERIRAAQARKFENAEYRQQHIGKLVASNQSPAIRALRRQQMIERWRDPEERAKMLAGAAKANGDPDVRARAAEKRRKQWADPVEHARRVEAMLAAHATKWFFVKGERFKRAVDAATHFGVSVTTIQNWIKAGKAYVRPRHASERHPPR